MTMNKKLTMIGLTNSGKLLIFDILWIICNKIEKYRKWLRKGALDLTFPLLNDNLKTLLIIISIHVVIKWYHLDNNVTFQKYVYSRFIFDCNQLDVSKSFLPSTFRMFINYHQYYQIICKKRKINLDNRVKMKIKI